MSKNDPNDLETRLKAIVPEPGPAVKRTVMAAFRRRHVPASIWSRGVPVYAVVVLLAMTVGVTLFAERTRTARSLSTQSIAAADTTFTWAIAVRDQL